MGYDSSIWKYKIGNENNYLNWDGNKLNITGKFQVNNNGVIVADLDKDTNNDGILKIYNNFGMAQATLGVRNNNEVSGGNLELLTNTGKKAIQAFAYSDNSQHELRFYNNFYTYGYETYGMTLQSGANGGLYFYSGSGMLYKGGISTDANGNLRLELQKNDGTNICRINSTDEFTLNLNGNITCSGIATGSIYSTGSIISTGIIYGNIEQIDSKRIYIRTTDPGVSAVDNSIWFDLTNKLIKYRSSGSWIAFGAAYDL